MQISLPCAKVSGATDMTRGDQTSVAGTVTSAERAERLLVLAAVGLPALSMLAVIAIVGTDVPFADGWDTPGILLETEVHRGLNARDFVAQHNESRPLFPRLVFYSASHVFGWHPKLFMLLSWLATLVAALVAARWLRQAVRAPLAFVASLIVSAFAFSLAQYANFLWGMQLVVFVPSLCLILALELARSRASPTFVLIGVIGLCSLSTFSYANGMICWLLAAPALQLVAAERVAERSRLRVMAGIYLACAVLALLLYFWDYARPPHHPSFVAALLEPAQAGLFFASWLGAPFSDAVWPLEAAPIAGCGVLVVVAGLVGVFVQQVRASGGRDLVRRAIPWLALLAYGLISGLVTTAGRVGSGEQAAFSQRYATQVMWIPVGLTGLVCVMRACRDDARVRARPRLDVALFVVLGGLAVLSWINGARQLPQYSKQLRQNALSLRFIEVLPENPLLARIHPMPQRIVPRARLLGERGLLDYRPIGSWVTVAAAEPVPAVGAVDVWQLEGEGGAPRQLVVDGTAVIPDSQRVADAVLLRWATRPGPARSWTALSVSDRDEASGRRIRFFDLLDVPSGADPAELELLAIDLPGQRLYRIARRAR